MESVGKPNIEQAAPDVAVAADNIPRRTFYVAIVVACILGIFILLGGRWWGYKVGFQAAYVPEHSHFVFEQKRANAFDKRIKDNRRCVDHMVHGIPSVDSEGFAAIGELMRNVGMLGRGMMDCNRFSSFGVPSRAEIGRIIPVSN